MFEGENKISVHFTRNINCVDDSPYIVKGQTVVPKDEAKILGAITRALPRNAQVM
jgi:hypothetical protein